MANLKATYVRGRVSYDIRNMLSGICDVYLQINSMLESPRSLAYVLFSTSVNKHKARLIIYRY